MTVWLLVFVPVGAILIARRVLGVLLHVLLQSEAVLCRVLSFGMERVGGLHHLLEVIRAGSSGRPTVLSYRDHIITLALAIFGFGGLGDVLPFLLAWPVVVFGGHLVFLIGVPINHVEEFLHHRWLPPR